MENKGITVTKTVSEKIAADYVKISFSAVGEAKKYGEAVDRADAIADKAVGALKNAGVGNVRMLGVNVSAVRDGKKIVAYRAVRNLSAGLDFDKTTLGSALDALSDSEGEWRISFALKDRSAASKSLVARAVKSARERAEAIAAAAGVKLGKLDSVENSSSDFDGGSPVMLRMARADCVPNSVDPEDITLSETVTCSWTII